MRGSISFRLATLFWLLGPVLYIATITPLYIYSSLKVMGMRWYKFAPLPGVIASFFSLCIPGPFISLATLPNHLKKLRMCIGYEKK